MRIVKASKSHQLLGNTATKGGLDELNKKILRLIFYIPLWEKSSIT